MCTTFCDANYGNKVQRKRTFRTDASMHGCTHAWTHRCADNPKTYCFWNLIVAEALERFGSSNPTPPCRTLQIVQVLGRESTCSPSTLFLSLSCEPKSPACRTHACFVDLKTTSSLTVLCRDPESEVFCNVWSATSNGVPQGGWGGGSGILMYT